MSKNLTLSQNYRREGYANDFSLEEGSILVGNQQPAGSPTISTTQHGVHYPNVESAIKDVYSLYTLAINTIIITSDGVSPAGQPQVTEFKFSGTTKYESLPVGSQINFDFFGFNTKILVGDNGEEVASKVKLTLEKAMGQNHVFRNVVFGATLDVLQCRFNDFQPHFLDTVLTHGITVTPVITSPAKPGYGNWTRIGTETKTLDGATQPVTLYYFRRDS